jgi:hypothetical protein
MTVCRRIDSYRTAIACFGNSPTEFGKLLADETEKWRKVIRAANIKAFVRSSQHQRRMNEPFKSATAAERRMALKRIRSYKADDAYQVARRINSRVLSSLSIQAIPPPALFISASVAAS